MRREHNIETSYIDWLKSIGCLIYLPLSYDGDLQDRISGLSLQLTGQGSMIWDNAQQRYKLTSPSSYNQYVAKLDNGLTASSFPDDKYTTCYRIKKITNSSSKYLRGISPNSFDEITDDQLNQNTILLEEVMHGQQLRPMWRMFVMQILIEHLFKMVASI